MFGLLRKHPFVLGFCFIVCIFTCLGQTFFISWFNPYVLEDLKLTRTELSLIYSSATFLSSFLLPYIGRKIDTGNLIMFSIWTTLAITFGFFALAYAPNWWCLFLAYFIIRSFGQMTLGLISSTTLAKKFGKHRGKAVSLAQLGRTLGESALPLIIVLMIKDLGWQSASMLTGVGLAVIFIPVILIFLTKMNLDPLYDENELIGAKSNEEEKEFNKKDFYKVKPVILILLANALIPFTLTGIFFQQTSIAEIKGWSQVIMSGAFSAYGIVQTSVLLIGGVLVDRFTATRLLPIQLIPIILGLGVLKFFDHGYAPYIYMGLFGIGTGLTATIKNSFYAENFSLGHLGQIKGIDSSYVVKATAFAPIFFAFLLDEGVSISMLVNILWGVVVTGTIFYIFASFYFVKEQNASGEQ